MQRTLPLIAVNGVIDAQVSPLDRGFAYGDGVFETCKMTNAKIPLWGFHMERLLISCKKLFIPIDQHLIENQLADVILSLNAEDKINAVVKITVTRGQGGRGYSIPTAVTPTLVIGVFPPAQYPASHFLEGITVKLCDQRLSCNKSLAGLKHLNRLEQILARAEWQDESIAEGILCDTNGYLIEAVSSNIFLVKNSEIFTPDLSESGVAGVMRRLIIEHLAPKIGLGIQIKKCDLNDFVSADEVFLCNSNYGIWPVRKFFAEPVQEFYVGDITRRLQTQLEETLQSHVSQQFV